MPALFPLVTFYIPPERVPINKAVNDEPRSPFGGSGQRENGGSGEMQEMEEYPEPKAVV